MTAGAPAEAARAPVVATATPSVGGPRRQSARTSLNDRFQGLALVAGVSFDSFDQVRNQVVAPLQLCVDVGPRVLGLFAKLHQGVAPRSIARRNGIS